MSENEVSLLQKKINEMAEKRLDADLEKSFRSVKQWITQPNYHVRLISLSHETPTPAIVNTMDALNQLEKAVKATLLPKYIENDTQAFLNQVDSVRQVLEQ